MNNNRLKKVLEFIEPSSHLADVGCDHGYLAIEAIKKGVPFVQLIDNKEGPLNVAINNLRNYEDECKVVYSLSSGLNSLHEKVDTIAICGMGGELIVQILNEKLDFAKKMKRLILQANSKNSLLREFLLKNSFIITDEAIVLDKEKVYEIIVCNFVNYSLLYNKKDYWFGPILRKNKDQLFVNKWKNKLSLDMEILKNNIDFEKKKEIEEEVRLIKEVLYES